MYFIYSFLMGLAALLLVPYWLVQGLRQGKYLSNLWQRLGFAFPSLAALPAERAGAIWIHAVSVGEDVSKRNAGVRNHQFAYLVGVTHASGLQ